MKTFLVTLVLLAAFFRASAQVSVELGLDQDEFLPNEAVRLAVKITNRSGQQVHLGVDPNWLTFNVEAASDFVVIKKGEVPVVEPFDLESSQMGTKKVDLQPYFELGKPGRYKVTATVRIKEWGLTITSPPKTFDVISGAELWSQDFGVKVAADLAPEPRKYTLLKANYLRKQLRLYMEVGTTDGVHVFKVTELGPLVSFSSPEAQVDRISQLHVLWQSGPQSFNCAIIGPDGALVSRDIYDNYGSRPHLAVDTNGQIVVLGGVRRPKPGDLPVQKSPDAPTAPPAKP